MGKPMKGEITCGSCGAVWHLEAKADAGEMLCPVCLARIEFGEFAAHGGAARSAAGGALPPEVVCPRCKLHFSPLSKRSRPDPGSAERRKCLLVVENQK
jgi:hypothetical protein